eukprot:TRINITY_DN4154_c1_g1_i1.p1 TRINITY_DN4154_c1_g1~~TRINITY_DN4154_c1_g1_i1.p1  ORF type:complete len:248 (-),score=18.64 TRINITY_DN4154_c1_g1_i1:58-696(-)
MEEWRRSMMSDTLQARNYAKYCSHTGPVNFPSMMEDNVRTAVNNRRWPTRAEATQAASLTGGWEEFQSMRMSRGGAGGSAGSRSAMGLSRPTALQTLKMELAARPSTVPPTPASGGATLDLERPPTGFERPRTGAQPLPATPQQLLALQAKSPLTAPSLLRRPRSEASIEPPRRHDGLPVWSPHGGLHRIIASGHAAGGRNFTGCRDEYLGH